MNRQESKKLKEICDLIIDECRANYLVSGDEIFLDNLPENLKSEIISERQFIVDKIIGKNQVK